MVETLAWFVLAYLSGSVPYSVWLGKLRLRTDIRRYGDGNPGASNVWRGGARWLALLVVVLDFGKGAVPVGLAKYEFGLTGVGLALVALGPILGHAFSLFLRFRGGKALAVTFGVWTGLTLWVGPVTLGLLFLLGLVFITVHAWAVMIAFAAFLAFLLITGSEPVLLLVWVGNALILGWKHRHELHEVPRLRIPGR